MAATHNYSYLSKVCESLPPEHPLRQNHSSPPFQDQRAFYTCLNGDTGICPNLQQLLRQHKGTETNNQLAVCIIENISRELMNVLGTEWNIYPAFFTKHAANPNSDNVWDSIMNPGGKWELWAPSRVDSSYSYGGHIEGVFEHLTEDRQRAEKDRFPRQLQTHPRWGLQSNSKISYCRVSKCLYLILTDLPLRMSSLENKNLLQTHLSFRTLFSRNYGGHVIPQLYRENNFSAFDIMTHFVDQAYAWHWRILFAEHLQDNAVSPMILANFIAASLWRINFEYLEQQIYGIAFKDVRRPSILINDRLHDKRQELAGLQAAVRSARKWIPIDGVNAFLQHIREAQPTSPHDALDQILEEADDLYRFLMDTCQFLMGSISVLDSQTSLEEARRSTTLTQMAAVYLPLSLATDIFGMNIKEINDSPLSVWVVFVALAILAVGTILLLLGTSTIRAVALLKMQTMVRRLGRWKTGRSAKTDFKSGDEELAELEAPS